MWTPQIFTRRLFITLYNPEITFETETWECPGYSRFRLVYGQDLRMEVPKTVPGDPELQLPSMAVGMAQPVSVTLVPVLLLP